jgi:hypothetical protein
MAEANRGSRPAVPSPGAYLAWAVARLFRATTETPSQFAERANARAGRRRSPWNLLLLPAAICPFAALWYVTARVLETLYTLCHNTPSSTFLPDGVAGVLMALGPLFAWFAPAMIIANCLAWLVPAARRTFEQEAAPFPGVTFRSANAGFFKIAVFMTPVGLALGTIGALLP